MSSNTFNFEITKVMSPTEGQKKVGIHGTFNVDLKTASGLVVVSMYDMKLCINKEGKHYIQAPSKKVGEGEGAKWFKYYSIFPNKEDWSKQEPLLKSVLEHLKTAPPPGANKKAPQSSTSTTSTPASDEAW